MPAALWQIHKLLDDHIDATGVKQLTAEVEIFNAEAFDEAVAGKLAQARYRQRAGKIFNERVTAWTPHFERLGYPRPQIAIRQMQARGKITFNLKLVMVPRQLIDYVIFHELGHLAEHNHSKGFYTLLALIMPDWGERREKLERFDFG
ncbi:MAG: M48 family metallopeptidase [Anaerolineales bacterium]